MTNESGTFRCIDTIYAQRYDGTRESADEIARSFGLRVVAHHQEMSVVYDVPPSLDMAPGQESDGSMFGVTSGGWVWHDTERAMIGAEWGDYFREHYAAVGADSFEQSGQPAIVADGDEPAEVSAVKNIVLSELEDIVAEANENAGFTDDGPSYDAIDLAETIVQKILAAGVSIPDSVVDPISLTSAASDAL